MTSIIMNHRIKTSIALLLLALIPIVSMTGCRRDRSFKPLSQLKREQRRAIDHLLPQLGRRIVTLSNEQLPTPTDSTVFYLFPNGLYMRVIDAGGEKASLANGTEIEVQFKGYRFTEEARGDEFNAFSGGVQPVYFRYVALSSSEGTQHFDLIANNFSEGLSRYMNEGLAYPMTLLGDGAQVELIIPFELGPTADYTRGYSIYIERAAYTFYHKPRV